MAPGRAARAGSLRVERATAPEAATRAQDGSNAAAPARQRVKNSMYAAFVLYFILMVLRHGTLPSHALYHLLCAIIAVRTVDEFNYEEGAARGDSLRLYALLQVAEYYCRVYFGTGT